MEKYEDLRYELIIFDPDDVVTTSDPYNQGKADIDLPAMD